MDNFDSESGSFTLVPSAKPVAGKIELQLKVAGSDKVIKVPLTVKVSQIKLKLGKSSISLGTAEAYSVPVTVAITPGDYIMENPVIRITDKSGKIQYEHERFDQLSVEYRDGKLYVGTTKHTISTDKGETYKLWISPYEGGTEVALIVQLLSIKKSVVSATVKSTGTVDLSFPSSKAVVTATYKNYELQGNETFTYKITAKKAREGQWDSTDLFDVSQAGVGKFAIKEKSPGTLDESYEYTFELGMGTSGELIVDAAPVKIAVKRTAIQLKLGKSSITINPAVKDTAVVSVVPNNDMFVMEQPVIKIMDSSGKVSAEGKLDATYDDGRLKVAANAQTVPGAKYKVLLQAGVKYKAATLNVTISDPVKTKISAKTKVKGSIDVIRPDTAIEIGAPMFTNFNGGENYIQTVSIVAFNGKTELGDATSKFTVVDNGDHTFTLHGNGEVDHTIKYVVRIIIEIPTNNGKPYRLNMPDQSIKVTMGKAKIATDVKAVQIYAKDKHSKGGVKISCQDSNVGKVARVRIAAGNKVSPFNITDFGGNQYALGFAPGMALSAKSGNVKLEVFLEGNITDKPNGTVTVKVNIK